MKKFPYYAGGYNHIDSEIIRKSKGEFISKVGAEGIIIICNKNKSMVIKISDGSSRIRSFIALQMLLKFKWLDKKDIKDSLLEEILLGEIKNHSNKVVGHINLY